MDLDTSKCLPCLVVATGPFTTITLDEGDKLDVSLAAVNAHSYDRLRLCRTTLDLDLGIGPLASLLTYTAAVVMPPVPGMTPLKAVEAVNRFLFELLLGGIMFDAAAPEDVGRGLVYHTGYFQVTSSARGANFSRLLALQAGDVSTYDSIALVQPRSYTAAEINAALAVGRPLVVGLSDVNPTILLDGLTALKNRRHTSSLVFLWSTIETLVNRLWHEKVQPVGANVPHRPSFVTGRGWSAAHKVEVLFQIGVVEEALYGQINKARRARNSLAHEGTTPSSVDCEAALQVTFALLGKLVPESEADRIRRLATGYGQPRKGTPEAEPLAWRHLPPVPGNERWGDADYPRYPAREWTVISPEVRASLATERRALGKAGKRG